MRRFAEFVLHHRVVICVSWLVLFLAGGAAAGQLADRLTFDFSLPGQPGYATEVRINETYGVSSFDTYVPVLTMPEGQTVQDNLLAIGGVFDAIRTAAPQLRVVDLGSTGDEGFISADGRTTFALVQGPLPAGFGPGLDAQFGPAFSQAAAAAGFSFELTSYGLLSAGGETQGPSVLLETLFGAVGALAVLIFV